MNRSCQRQTQVFDLPVRRMISLVPTPSALERMIAARQACFCEALRSLVIASSRPRTDRVIVMEIPVRMHQTRTATETGESQSGLFCQAKTTSAAGRQCHRFYSVRIQHQREMAGAAQRDRAARDASCGVARCDAALGIGQFGAIQALAPSFGMVLRPVGVSDASEIERAVTAFAQSANNGGLIVTASAPATIHRDLIIALATRHRLPRCTPPATSSPAAD